jgi:hypothetical protein
MKKLFLLALLIAIKLQVLAQAIQITYPDGGEVLTANSSDFITMEPIDEINFHQFLSYKDIDGFIYGFDITSLHNLYFKSNKEIKNPYNRSLLPDKIFKIIKCILKISSCFCTKWPTPNM